MALIRIICMLGIILNFSSCRSVEQGMRESFLPAPGDNPSAVSLDIGDEIAIAVWRNAEFDQTVKIDENGNIYLPLVGEMRIVGKTTTQIRRQIEEQLARFIVDPHATVSIASLESRRFHVLGEVVNPGTFSLVRSMLIWETVLEAGGVTSDGNGKKILLIRKKGEQSDIITVDVDSVVKSGIFGPDMYVKKGDIIYVQPKTVANVQAYLDRFKNLLSPFVSLESAIIMAPQMIDALKGESSSDTGLSVGVGQ